LFTGMKSAKEIWDALEFKYRAEEQGTNKCLIAKYFDFKFIDTKPLLEQVHELQVIMNKIRALKIEIPETFQVGQSLPNCLQVGKIMEKSFYISQNILPLNIFKNIFV
ncbi:UBN2 domain-containing protein, partial [Cephalotus follicularis]